MGKSTGDSSSLQQSAQEALAKQMAATGKHVDATGRKQSTSLYIKIARWRCCIPIASIALVLGYVGFCLHLKWLNSYLWSAPAILSAPGFLLFLYLYLTMNRHHYFFDPKHNSCTILQKENGDFEPHSKRYNDLAKLLITLSAGVIAFLVNTLANEKKDSPPILSAIHSTAPIVVGFFGSSIALLILFLLTQAAWYEAYCHSAHHDTYTRWKYASCNTFAYTGLLAFILGVIWFAQNIFLKKP